MDDVSSLSVAEIRRLVGGASGACLQDILEQCDRDPRKGVAAIAESARRRLSSERAEQIRLSELYRLEDHLRAEGHSSIAGVDEVGRGALAGPLTVGACILPPGPRIEGLDDSKRLSPERREAVAARIREVALAWCVVHVTPGDVDAVGISVALKRGMRDAVAGLETPVERVLVDGLPVGVHTAEIAIVGGDRRVAAIAAASVLAKVERDAHMRGLDPVHPHYGFFVNKGYGTSEHLEALRVHGHSPVHRLTFIPGSGAATLF